MSIETDLDVNVGVEQNRNPQRDVKLVKPPHGIGIRNPAPNTQERDQIKMQSPVISSPSSCYAVGSNDSRNHCENGRNPVAHHGHPAQSASSEPVWKTEEPTHQMNVASTCFKDIRRNTDMYKCAAIAVVHSTDDSSKKDSVYACT